MIIRVPQGCNTSLLLATQEHNGIIIKGRSRIERCPDMEKWAYLSLYKAFKYAESTAEPKAPPTLEAQPALISPTPSVASIQGRHGCTGTGRVGSKRARWARQWKVG